MVKARILAAAVVAVMLLSVFLPASGAVASVASPPNKPVNLSPDNATTEISPLHTFMATVGDNDTLIFGQWQIVQSEAEPALSAYDKPLWDSGLSSVATIQTPVGLLDYAQQYWWRVRVQDNTGAWSDWSAQTWFRVMPNSPPNQPINQSPADGTTGVSVAPALSASAFSDPDPTGYDTLNESLAAAQWEVTTIAGNYADLAASHTGHANAVPALEDRLEPGVVYYWHVRYQDNHGNWSAWSKETSFTTRDVAAPVAAFTADRDSIIGGEDMVTFTDNSTPVGEIDRWTWEFGDGTSENWTYLTRPSGGQISHRYSAADGGARTVKLTVYNSAAATGVSETMQVAVHVKPAASFTMAPASVKAGAEITITDDSTPVEDITSWEWQFDDGTTVAWASPAERDAAGGKIKHTFDNAGTRMVSLTVKGALGESFYSKQVRVTGGEGFHFGLWMIGVAAVAVAVLAGAVYLVRGRKAK